MRKRTAFDLMMEKSGTDMAAMRPFHRREMKGPQAVMAIHLSFIVEQMREEFAHIARRIEMPGDAPGAAADRERKAVEIGHDREHAFVGDVVADEERTAALEGLVHHQFPYAGRLGEAGMLYFANCFPGSTSIGAFGRSARISDTAS